MTQPPKYLRDPATGGCRTPPPAVAELLQCPLCGAALVPAETGWVCGQVLHGRLYPAELLVDRIQERLPAAGDRRRSARRVVFLQRRVLSWRARNSGG